MDGHALLLEQLRIGGLLLLHLRDVGFSKTVRLEPGQVLVERVARVVGSDLRFGDQRDSDLA